MWIFENTANGYRETVTSWSILWALLFGWIYLAAKGLWIALVANVLTAAAFVPLLGPGAVLFCLIAWVVTALMVPSLLRKKYLRAGWKLVSSSPD
jgi:hypothetical protein